MDEENNCILCYRPGAIANNRKSVKKRKLPLLNDQLEVIFILRQLLEIPKPFCENLLSQSGNPSEWITRCDRCTKLIEESHETFKEISRLQSKYKNLKSRIATTLSNSKFKIPVDNAIKTTDRIRNYLFKDSTPNNYVPKLDTDLVLKVENDTDIQDDWALVNYNENADHKTFINVGRKGNAVGYNENEQSNSNEFESANDGDEDSDGDYQLNDADDSDWNGSDNGENSDAEIGNPNDKGSKKISSQNSEEINKERKKKCDDCGLTFQRPSYLTKHIIIRHMKNLPYKCDKCNLSFKFCDGLKKHFKRKHPEDTDTLKNVTPAKVVCEICGQSYSEEYLKCHMLIHSENDEKKFKCEICNKGFYSPDKVQIHRRGIHYKELNLEPYECKECNKIFKSQKCLNGHNLTKHKVGVKYSCSICNAAFRDGSYLKRHLEKLHEIEKFQCDLCPKFFKDKSKLESHVASQHTRHYECEICKKVLPRMDLLRHHMRGKHYLELNLEPIKCDECGKIFKCHKSLGKHTVNIHTKDFKEFCPTCNAGFRTKGEVDIHVRRMHTKEKNFTCSYCGTAFFSKNVFDAHVISQHTKEFAVTCEICGHGSAALGIHEKHMKIHNAKNYTCELCGNAYKLQYELQEHQRGKHYEEFGLEPFKCTECDKICNSRSSLRLHVIRDHTNCSNFPCLNCDKVFLAKPKLQEHVRRHHTGETVPM